MERAIFSRRLAQWAGLTLGLWAFGLAPARADLMRYQFTGVITYATQGPSGLAGSSASDLGSVGVGTRFTGTFAYDPTEAPNSANMPPGMTSSQYCLAQGQGTANADGLSVQIGGQSLIAQTGGLSIATTAGITGGALPTSDVTISNANFGDVAPYTAVALVFQGADPTLYPPLGPPTMLNLSDFIAAGFAAQLPGGTAFRGTIDGLTLLPSSTPEPSTCLILGSAAVVYLARRRIRLVAGATNG